MITKLKKKLDVIEAELVEASKPFNEQIDTLKVQIQAEHNKAFDNDKTLQQALIQLETTSQLTSIPNDEWYHRWVRYSIPETFDRVAFESYLDDRCVQVDFENSTLHSAEGPCMIINDDGIVYDQDSHKTVCTSSDYETITERNALIEQYMERYGYYPSVVLVDRYGEPIGYADTQETKDTKCKKST